MPDLPDRESVFFCSFCVSWPCITPKTVLKTSWLFSTTLPSACSIFSILCFSCLVLSDKLYVLCCLCQNKEINYVKKNFFLKTRIKIKVKKKLRVFIDLQWRKLKQ